MASDVCGKNHLISIKKVDTDGGLDDVLKSTDFLSKNFHTHINILKKYTNNYTKKRVAN